MHGRIVTPSFLIDDILSLASYEIAWPSYPYYCLARVILDFDGRFVLDWASVSILSETLLGSDGDVSFHIGKSGLGTGRLETALCRVVISRWRQNAFNNMGLRVERSSSYIQGS